MGYKKIRRISIIFIITGFWLFNSCSEKKNSGTPTNYYVEFVNFDDSLEQYISSNIFGKVAFYKKNKLEVISINYITDLSAEMHYFKSIKEAGKEITSESKKIRVEFFGNYNMDSIRYSLQKFNYKNREWNKISDIGILKGFTTYKMAKEFTIKEFGTQIINSVAAYSYE